MRQVLRDKIETLLNETIVPALREDFEFKDIGEAQETLDWLIEKLGFIDSEELVSDEPELDFDEDSERDEDDMELGFIDMDLESDLDD